MRELRSEEIGDRRVALVETSTERYSVTIAVRGPEGTWEDISLQSDQDLGLHTASLCYRLRRTEQQARAIRWNDQRKISCATPRTMPSWPCGVACGLNCGPLIVRLRSDTTPICWGGRGNALRRSQGAFFTTRTVSCNIYRTLHQF